MPFARASAEIFSIACSLDNPVYGPDSASRPYPVYALSIRSARKGRSLDWLHDDAKRNLVFLRELEVPLVMSRHGHHGARAVFGQHEVCYPDGHAFARKTAPARCGCLSSGGMNTPERYIFEPVNFSLRNLLVFAYIHL